MSAFPYLPRRLSEAMFAKLVMMLPPPAEGSAEALMNRDIAAMSSARCLGPILSMEEATLAITIVAADSHAQDSLRLAAERPGDLKTVMQCRAQAMAMLRARHKAAEKLERLVAAHEPEALPTATTGSGAATSTTMVSATMGPVMMRPTPTEPIGADAAAAASAASTPSAGPARPTPQSTPRSTPSASRAVSAEQRARSRTAVLARYALEAGHRDASEPSSSIISVSDTGPWPVVAALRTGLATCAPTT